MSDTATAMSASAVPSDALPSVPAPAADAGAVAVSPAAWPRALRRALLGGLAVAALVSLGGTGWLARQLLPAPEAWQLGLLGLGHAALLLGIWAAWRQAGEPTGQQAIEGAPASLPAVTAGTVLLAAALGAWLGWSGFLLTVPMLAAATCLAMSMAQRTRGLVIATTALGLVVGLAAAHAQGALPAGPAAPWLGPLLSACAVAGCLGLGLLLAHLSQQQRTIAMRQAQRWQAMRRLATDVCWETDATLRITALAWRNRHGRLMALTDDYLGRRPWDMPVLSTDHEAQDLLRANVDGRDRIQDVPMAWRCPDGRRRHYLVSGEPDFDAEGRFVGYWGVARDVSIERHARQAMQASSRRYQRLVRRLPAAAIVHREGRILYANAAAAALLGYESADLMPGHDLLAEHLDDEQRDMALERLDHLESEPALEALPVVPRRLLRCDGQPVFTLATGLRAEHAGRPALLAVFLDETPRHGALQAQQRADLLLSRVLALSPDIVALCDLKSGRCESVNDSLGRVLGLGRNAWIGPDAPGPWRQPADLDQLLRAVQAQGLVRDRPMDFVAGGGLVQTLWVSATVLSLEDGRRLLLLARASPGAPPQPSLPPSEPESAATTASATRPADAQPRGPSVPA